MKKNKPKIQDRVVCFRYIYQNQDRTVVRANQWSGLDLPPPKVTLFFFFFHYKKSNINSSVCSGKDCLNKVGRFLDFFFPCAEYYFLSCMSTKKGPLPEATYLGPKDRKAIRNRLPLNRGQSASGKPWAGSILSHTLQQLGEGHPHRVLLQSTYARTTLPVMCCVCTCREALITTDYICTYGVQK